MKREASRSTPPRWATEPFGGLSDVFTVFDQQDSGCVSYGIRIAGQHLLLKTGLTRQAQQSLQRAIVLHNTVQHPVLVPLLNHTTCDKGVALLYPWVNGELLYHPNRTSPSSVHHRFRRQPVSTILTVLHDIFAAHLAMAKAGLVSSDWYDGCLMYNFQHHVVRIIDIDEFRIGAFTVDGDRTLGSTRFMAPEEYVHGARIDARTSVYHLARTANLLLDWGDCTGQFRGTAAQLAVVLRGQRSEPKERFSSVSAFVEAWSQATLFP